MEMEDHDNMKTKRHAPEQVIRKVAEGDEMLNKGATVSEVAQDHRITALDNGVLPHPAMSALSLLAA